MSSMTSSPSCMRSEIYKSVELQQREVEDGTITHIKPNRGKSETEKRVSCLTLAKLTLEIHCQIIGNCAF